MNQDDINKGIRLLCNTSATIKAYYEDDQNIVDALNSTEHGELQKCIDYYKTSSGVVVDIRKDILSKLISGKQFTVESLLGLIKNYKRGKENQYRAYKETYSIVFPIITFYGHNPQRIFVEAFTNQLINDLKIENEVKVVSFDFQGVRQQGSARYWVAIYNKHQENQSHGIQFFFDFFEGKISYAVYRHIGKFYLKPKVSVTPQAFSYDAMISYFNEYKQALLHDKPEYSDLKTIELGNHKLYKISHGAFKANKFSKVIEAFKSNNWIVLHENTGKGQAEKFKNDLKTGDYIYITIGSKELVEIARISSNDWGNVPNDIVESDGWIYREVEFIQPAVKKKPNSLKDLKAFYPSANSTFSEIKRDHLTEANDVLFKPYFNTQFTTASTMQNLSSDKRNKELNQILFGPPGTGKTFCLQNNYMPEYTTTEDSITAEQHFTQLVQSLSWWQVIGIALLENNNLKVSDIHSSRWVKKKAELSESKNVRATMWGTLQMHTVNESTTVNYTQRQVPLIFDKNSDKSWKIFEEEARETAPELFDHLDSVNNFQPSPNNMIKRYEFVTFHQSYSYEDFVEGIKPVMVEDADNQSELKYEIKSGIFKQLCKRAENDPENEYALFIDEINRGNVSQIFGELITLIEQDKRKGEKNELSLTLPYSRKSFTVPKNLAIIGTMNTADRSVEALDTALRRRFSFIEMTPIPELIKTKGKLVNGIINGIDLSFLLKTINRRVEKLLNKDHVIGHSYFMSIETLEDLKAAFQNKIIPLLQEYFFGDYGKIGLIIGSKFFDIKDEDDQLDGNFFAPFDDYDSSPLVERKVYHLKNIQKMTDELFIDALNDILPKPL